jgi:hypothetical protein
MIDIITPIIALTPYIVIAWALAAIPVEAPFFAERPTE